MHVRVVPLSFREHVSALVEHRADVAFVRPAPVDDRIRADVMTVERRIVVVPQRSEIASAATVPVADVLDLEYVGVPPDSVAQFADFMYFTPLRGGEPPRRSRDIALTPHDVLLSASLGRGIGSSLDSFRRYYRWPGVAFVTVAGAPPERSVLASRAADRNPHVRAFRTIAATLAAQGPFTNPEAARPR